MNIVHLEKDRKDLALLFSGVGVEVGVADGDFAEFILSNPEVTKLWGVDLYQAHKGYTDYTRGTTFNNMRQHALQRLIGFGDRHEFIFKYSIDAVKDFENDSLDFVYIDADHSYKTCLEDITEWVKKVKSGGFVAGDDYEVRRSNDIKYGVIHAVNEYVKTHDIPELFVYYGGETPNNWLFVKP
jgi:hypothetical protein